MKSMFGHSIRSEILALYVVDSLVIFTALYLSFISAGAAASVPYEAGPALLAAMLAICTGLAAGVTGLYQPGTWLRAGRIVSGTVIAALMVTVVGDVLAPDLFAGPAGETWSGVLRTVVIFATAMVLTRLLLVQAARAGLCRRRIVVLRDGSAGLSSRWLGDDPYFQVVAALPGDAGTLQTQLPAALRSLQPWAVVAENLSGVPAGLRDKLHTRGVRVFDEAEFWERRLGRVNLAELPENWQAQAVGLRENPAERALRRGLDIVVSVLLLAFTFPLLLLAGLAVRLESPGPVFYRQERVGKDGRCFTLFKLRSMVADAEAGGQPRWAVQGDKRVTRVGRFLRLTRIDEIPQILNVLRGDMALIGPRPERPVFVQQLGALIPHYADRALVKPGITGWAQVNYPYGASVEDAREKLAYDLYYVKRRSLFLDLLILVATVRVVLFQEGSR